MFRWLVNFIWTVCRSGFVSLIGSLFFIILIVLQASEFIIILLALIIFVIRLLEQFALRKSKEFPGNSFDPKSEFDSLKFRAIVEQFSEGFVLIDDQARIIEWNHAQEKNSGMKRSDVIGRLYYEVQYELLLPERKTPERKQYFKKILEEAIKTGDSPFFNTNIELSMMDQSGKRGYFEQRVFPVRFGNRLFIGSVTNNIMERKLSDLALRESEEKFRSFVEQSGEGYVIVDPAGRVQEWNSALETILEISRQEAVGMNMLDLLLKINPKALDFAGWAVKQDPLIDDLQKTKAYPGFNRQIEFTFLAKNGQKKICSQLATPIQRSDGIWVGVIIEDITEKKRYEEKLITSLQEKEILLKEIHHRVKNNLQIITSLLAFQSAKIGSPEMKEQFVEAQRRIRSMALVHEKLYQSNDFSKVEFSSYIKNIVNDIRQWGIPVHQEIEVRLDLDELFINIETAIPSGLILNELLTNAYKYAFPENFNGRPVLEVGLKQGADNKTIEIIVKDNGVGLKRPINWESMETLGLKLVHLLVGQLEGAVEVIDNRPGTCFIIRFIPIIYR